MSNFDLKKYLVENKLTANSKMLNEGINDISDAAVNLLMDKSKYMTKPGSDKGVYVVYDLSLPKGKGSFGDDNSTQKVGYWWTKDSVYKDSASKDIVSKYSVSKDSASKVKEPFIPEGYKLIKVKIVDKAKKINLDYSKYLLFFIILMLFYFMVVKEN